jgi:2'-5' RNA ligase
MSGIYLLAILPPHELARDIHQIRLHCSEKFGVLKALRPPVHISMYRPFRLEEEFENNFILLIQSAIAEQEVFEQEIENFEAFNTHAIVLRALLNTGILNLYNTISTIMREKGIDKHPTDIFPFHPHLTIAYRDIKPEVFPLIWEDYKNKKFNASFRADHLSLLKHDGNRWLEIKNYPFRETYPMTENDKKSL